MQNKLPILEISPYLLLFLPAALLLVPFPWVFAVICSLLIHESCHILVARFLGKQAFRICLSYTGAEIATEHMSKTEEMVVAAAGPCSCVFPLLFARIFPRLAVCSVIHTAYNLLPFYPLDGGRILHCLLKLFLPLKTARKISAVIENVFFCLILLSIILFCRTGLLVAVAGTMFAIRQYKRKKSCKDVQLGVQ